MPIAYAKITFIIPREIFAILLEKEWKMDSVAITIINTILLFAMCGSIIALVAGAVGNAMREKRGEPIKKRGRMIVLEITVILICLYVYKIISNV